MARLLTDKEIEDILNDTNPTTLFGFGGYIYFNKVDIYTYYTSNRNIKINDDNFYKQNDKSNNLNFNSYKPLWVCSVAGYHEGLRSL